MGDIIIIAILAVVGAWILFSCLHRRGCASCSGCGACGSCPGACCKHGGANCHATAQPGKSADSKPPNN